ERRTAIVADPGDLAVEDVIEDQDVVVTLTHLGYIKRLPVNSYRAQRRGGRGISALHTREGDFGRHWFITALHRYVLFFTNRGRVYRLKRHELPEPSRTARGTALVNLLPLENGEWVQAVIPVAAYQSDRFMMMATRKGVVKKTVLTEFDS